MKTTYRKKLKLHLVSGGLSGSMGKKQVRESMK